MLKNCSPGPALWLLLTSDLASRGHPTPRRGLSSSSLTAEGSCPSVEADSVTGSRVQTPSCAF